jgi:hypothetical protein
MSPVVIKQKPGKMLADKRKQQREFHEFVHSNGLSPSEAISIASFLPRNEKPKIAGWPR